MKALIIRGKFCGHEVEVSQWCNDWFTLDPRECNTLSDKEKDEVMTLPFSPTQLAFSITDYNKIASHKNNGTLFEEFEQTQVKNLGNFEFSFKRRKPKAPKQAVEKDRKFLTPKQAWAIVDKSNAEECHVFHNMGFGLLGFDVSIERIKVAIGQAKTREIGGAQCLGMGHGLVVIPKGAKLQGDIWFIKHDEKAIKKYL